MAQSKQYLLSINCGSSSIKFAIYTAGHLKCKVRGRIVQIGSSDPLFTVSENGESERALEMQEGKDILAAIGELRNWLSTHYRRYPITAIGHRIVQGGPDHMQAGVIDEILIEELNRLSFLAPNHLPDELAAIKTFKNAFPEAVQVACYDTGFHQYMPEHVRQYPLPEKYRQKELIKYGFHGLSCEYIIRRLGERYNRCMRQKIIIAHLGNGSSVTAIKHGKSIDTTMGLTPMGGVLMGTRSGDIDPGVPIFILKQWKLSADELDRLFSKESGLEAIAGTADMRELLVLEHTATLAAVAVTSYVYHIKKQIGALAAAMKGLDMLVFTGGIGENSDVIRERICDGLEFLGIRIHPKHNKHHKAEISSKSGSVKVLVMPTDEERMIAHHIQQVVNYQESNHYEYAD